MLKKKKKKTLSLRKLPDGELKEDAPLQFQAQLSPPGIASQSHPFLNSKQKNTDIQRIDNKKLKKKKKRHNFYQGFSVLHKKEKEKKLQLDIIRTLNT